MTVQQLASHIVSIFTPAPSVVGAWYDVRTTLYGWQPGQITHTFVDACTGQTMAYWLEAEGRCSDVFSVDELVSVE